ncbi:hypothetical protein M407DRAFT_207567 [Tulasnella calospora MUT 4182]|uniref:Survival protein SurE-like phosphatase/nucleotidase domain-containing protein n=1 Tax=Tulasnella calospora MUT 4182 TaxID=1051891 RepID=A0A0C3KWF2_9AGAM|nr:hypothetical protein M407DRAFT_207567 [Tulasnella calospora MUT 4182]
MSVGSMAPPRVLISNDDGPPGKESPYVFGLYMTLTHTLGWDVKVVVPSSQKSWIGKAYQIKDIIKGAYYYPKAPDGKGETSEFPRPLKEGEVGEWILLDGTPATCTNIALHNLYPGQIDLVISGPNYGRNTSSAFSLSSGTIGAALSACLSKTRAIALSFGTFRDVERADLGDYANTLGAKIIQKLWEDWGRDEEGIRNGEVDLYNVNIPIVNELRQPEGLEILWTRIWRNSYGQLFKRKEDGRKTEVIREAGPDAPPEPPTSIKTSPSDSELPETSSALVFQFAPRIDALVNPPLEMLPHGSDGWAMHYRKASVTPLRASFAEPLLESLCLATERGTEGLGPGREFKP